MNIKYLFIFWRINFFSQYIHDLDMDSIHFSCCPIIEIWELILEWATKGDSITRAMCGFTCRAWRVLLGPVKFPNMEHCVATGNLNLVRWAYINGAPWSPYVCARAAGMGRLDILKWLRGSSDESEKCPWGDNLSLVTRDTEELPLSTTFRLRLNFSPCPVRFSFRIPPQTESNTFVTAAYTGNLKILKWLYEAGCPWGEMTFCAAVFGNNFEAVKWLHKSGCPGGDRGYSIARLMSHKQDNSSILEYLEKVGYARGRIEFVIQELEANIRCPVRNIVA